MAPPSFRRINGLVCLDTRDPRMRRLRRAGHVAEIHGNRLWNSSFLLMDYLKRHPLPAGSRVLELGCGRGLLGLFCAKRFGARVHGIDADPNVLPCLQLHAEVNGLTMTAERRTFDRLTGAFLGEFDLILGADICFWDDLGRQLRNLIRRARRGGAGRVMIADPGRPPFHDLVDSCMARLETVAHREVRIRRPVRATGELLIVG